jgi:hypothetical protein
MASRPYAPPTYSIGRLTHRYSPSNPAWTTQVAAPHRDYFWAPDATFANGRFLLYYSVSSWGKNTSAIGLATNPTLNPADPSFKWSDAGIVVRSFATNDFNTIDPALAFDTTGRFWLAFGSYWSGIKLIELNPATGHRIAPESPMYSLAFNDSIEAPLPPPPRHELFSLCKLGAMLSRHQQHLRNPHRAQRHNHWSIFGSRRSEHAGSWWHAIP